MTKRQFMAKYRDLRGQLVRALDRQANYLLRSGGVDIKQAGNDFILPKIVLAAALKREASAFGSLHPEHKEAVKNLERM